jgi:hypothetical protein
MRRSARCLFLLLVTFPIMLLAAPARPAETTPEGIEFFEKKIRPVLVEQCHKCHTGAKPKGKLLLDSRAALLKGGDSGAAIVPGQPDKSLLLKAIRYTSDELRMPPKSRLTETAVADFARWIELGAPWPESGSGATAVAKEFDLNERKKFWCWQPVRPVAVPAVKQKEWIRTPIDAFVLAKLEAAGLQPAAPADRRALVRRATYDLIGLPPTPQEIEAALADKSDDWFARVVDRLLASPHYGERWGRHWLDLVRYAETYGHEYDFEIPEAYQYRDYVIRAFNADVPYNQFVQEHVAGDLLPNPRRHPVEGFNESIVGSGFWFLHEALHSPVDTRVDEANRIDNQIDVFAKTFLGLTVSCARCHDHKFDAISTRDYHALMGYLQTSRQQRAFIDAPERLGKPLAELTTLQDAARPLARAATIKALQEEGAKLADKLRAGRAARRRPADDPLYAWSVLAGAADFTARRRELVKQLKDRAKFVVPPSGGSQPPEGGTTNLGGFSKWFITGAAFGDGSFTGGEVLQADPRRPIAAVVAAGTAHSGLISNRLQGILRSPSFVISKKKIHYHIAGKAGRVNLVLDGLQLIRAPIYGGLTMEVTGDKPWRTMDVSMWQGQRAYIEIIDDGAGFVALDQVLFSDEDAPATANQLVLQMLDDDAIDSLDALEKKYQDLCLQTIGRWQAGKLLAKDAGAAVALSNWMLTDPYFAASADKPANSELTRLLDACREAEARLLAPRRALAMTDGTPWTPHVYIRGNPKNLGPEVPRRYLEAIAGDQPSSSRLELARRLTDGTDPLLARVMVNRIWQHHFGEGIVRSVDNFGVLGERPTHPELLDWLAQEFSATAPASGGRKSPGDGRDRPWSIKNMHRLLMLSSTYQMSSRADDRQAEEKDPQNKLLHRMPIRRLEAECIRDAMLAISGRLEPTLFGPSVMPHLTPHMAGRGRPGQSGPLDGAGRRSIYIGVRRNFLTPMFLAFDYPIPFTTIGRRSVSNVPAQALALMNNPFVVQQAEIWAKRVLAEPERTAGQRITGMYVSAFGRLPTETEVADALKFVDEQGKQQGKGNEAKAWADLGHVLMNVKEFIFVN